MTPQFLEELKQTASRRKDGFDAANLENLSGDEPDQARRLLKQAVSNGHDTAVDALLALDGVSALETLTPLLSMADEYVRLRVVQANARSGTISAAVQAALAALLASKQAAIRVQALTVAQALTNASTKVALLAPIFPPSPMRCIDPVPRVRCCTRRNACRMTRVRLRSMLC